MIETAEWGDLLDRALARFGIGETIMWPVLRGNGTIIMHFRNRLAMRARVGDRVPVKTGGFVQKMTDEGWVQWTWFAADDPAAPPLTGRVLELPPPTPIEP